VNSNLNDSCFPEQVKIQLKHTKWAEVTWPAALYTAPGSGVFVTRTPLWKEF